MTDPDLVELFLARSEEAVPALQDQYGGRINTAPIAAPSPLSCSRTAGTWTSA